ncbi:MAG: hypothetical protein ACI85I_001883, partial [Arenicella sp.]
SNKTGSSGASQASTLEPNNLNFKIMNCTQYPNSR